MSARKIRSADVTPGDVILMQNPRYESEARTVEQHDKTSQGRTFTFTDGTSSWCGNATKVWLVEQAPPPPAPEVDDTYDETSELQEIVAKQHRPELQVGEWDSACDFLLDLSFENLFEQITSENTLLFRCKGCRREVPRATRKQHYSRHKTQQAQKRQEGSTRMANDKAKPKKETAKDQGVPDVYLADNGNFRPGLDAKYKSDLIKCALGLDTSDCAHVFEAKDAEARLDKRGWRSFLDRKVEILKEKKAAADAKAAEKEAAAREKAAAKANAKTSETRTSAAASGKDVKPDPKPAADRKTTAAGRRRTTRKKT
jgi:hypothetical protein